MRLAQLSTLTWPSWLLTIAVGVLFAPMRHAIGDGNVFSVFGVTTAVLTVLILALYKG